MKAKVIGLIGLVFLLALASGCTLGLPVPKPDFGKVAMPVFLRVEKEGEVPQQVFDSFSMRLVGRLSEMSPTITTEDRGNGAGVMVVTTVKYKSLGIAHAVWSKIVVYRDGKQIFSLDSSTDSRLNSGGGKGWKNQEELGAFQADSTAVLIWNELVKIGGVS